MRRLVRPWEYRHHAARRGACAGQTSAGVSLTHQFSATSSYVGPIADLQALRTETIPANSRADRAADRDEAFAESGKCFREPEDWAASEEAPWLHHGELEEQLEARGRELLRRLFQDRLDASASAEERRYDVAGKDGVVRTRAEKGRTWPLVTKFGQVTVSRIAYRSPGRPNVHPLDAALNLPEEKHSHGLRRLAAIEAARGSHEAAAAAVARATGVKIGKRQLEELARRAAAHVEAFYAWP